MVGDVLSEMQPQRPSLQKSKMPIVLSPTRLCVSLLESCLRSSLSSGLGTLCERGLTFVQQPRVTFGGERTFASCCCCVNCCGGPFSTTYLPQEASQKDANHDQIQGHTTALRMSF